MTDSHPWITLLETKFRRQVGTADSALVKQWLHNAIVGVQEKGGRYYERAQVIFPNQTTGRILDAGCGDGEVALRFALAGAQTVGVDSDAEFIEIARLRAQEFSGTEVEFYCADLCKPEVLGDISFDLILSIDVIEHFQDAVGYLSSLRELLRTGGRFWIFTPRRFAPANTLADPHYKLMGLTLLPNTWAAWYAVRIRRRVRQYEVTRLYTQRSLAKLAHACGLKISFQSTVSWKAALKKHAWLKSVARVESVARILYWLYRCRLQTIEVILALP